ncbi:D-alanyl-D-alanine carboxypeptidase/D-alanyl-D-alanine-endopeptidase [Flammeovirga sp. SubArs3]|uniref:D-alanyl-D-alanine carboxypeptidase/D-alanyl-D-alanine endopeptidase n=1 Tax=Flammeovirga sp. SubArs3 TaxID=2995316 RepID=UPI00248D1B7C|nr:D-alanyl-D-alanine carboxypeptidase/D-alanyl-D-alanine-endopeptidase [Flammeovirga sp. SubArs3]
MSITINLKPIRVIFCFLFFVVGCITKNPILAQQKQHSIDKVFKEFLAHDWMRGASVSFKVKSLEKKNINYEYQSTTSLTPASITKLFSTSVGLKVLGEDYKYETKVSYTGEIVDGVLDGDLIIHGAGDPTLTLRNLDSVIVSKLPDLKEIKGAIIADASLYGRVTTPPKWVWEDLGNYYGAGVSSLNINDNIYGVYLKTGSTGSKSTINEIKPITPYLTVESEVLAGEKGTGDNSFIFSSPYSDSHIIRGTLPPNRSNFRVKGGVTNPEYHTIWMLADTLASHGVKVDENQLKVVYNSEELEKSLPLCSAFSPTLSQIIDKTNKKSVNLYAEAVAKTVSIMETNSILPDSITASLIRNLEDLQLSDEGLFLEDGSGLSPFDAFSANHMVTLLENIRSTDYFDTFYNSLAVTGTSGTLKYFCRYNQAKGRVIGKSGSMRRVKSYAGYVKTVNNDTLVFTVIVNNFGCKGKEVRKALEPLMEELAK